ncbi:hypothetical protein HK102_000483 [Quaeritorhiza haematococci]|nr:hypothetical protein HK102_000483 [Quaeritorhiza haematococci]
MLPHVGVSKQLKMDDGTRANMDAILFMAGDKRANEHNRRARELSMARPLLDDEQLYQYARRWVIALLQKITYYEYLPALVGTPLPKYRGYNPMLDPSIDLFFLAAAFRYGHSAINKLIMRYDENGMQIPNGHILLRDGFFNPKFVLDDGIDSILRGLVSQKESKVDTKVVEDLRLFLPNRPFDLAAVNMQRGRDLGIPSYNDMRSAFGLDRAVRWSDISPDPVVQESLRAAYGNNLDNLDPWLGGLAEEHVSGSTLGELFQASVMEQFTRLRDADRFWFELSGVLPEEELTEIRSMTLSKLITLNTDIKQYPNSAFSMSEFFFEVGGAGVDLDSSNNNKSSDASVRSPIRRVALTDKYRMSWKVQGEEITFTLEVNFTGWFAVGFGGTGMNKVDIIAVRAPDGSDSMIVDDMWSESYNPASDTELGGSNNIRNVKDVTSSTSSQFAIEFTRLAKGQASDTRDVDIFVGASPPATRVIYAFSENTKKIGYHGTSNRGSVMVKFVDTEASSSIGDVQTGNSASEAEPDVWAMFTHLYFRIHGLLMFTTIGVLIPFGIFAVKYSSILQNYLIWHEWAMGLAGTELVFMLRNCITNALTLENRGWLPFPHVRLGLSAAVMMSFGRWYGVNDYVKNYGGYPILVDLYVSYFGTLLFIAFCYMYISQKMQSMYGAALDEIIYTWFKSFRPESESVEDSMIFDTAAIKPTALSAKRQESKRSLVHDSAWKLAGPEVAQLHVRDGTHYMAWEEFMQMISSGCQWTVISDVVFDLGSIIKWHPGGQKSIRMAIGRDATTIFEGREKVNPNNSGRGIQHRHSRLAHYKLQQHIVARILPGTNPHSIHAETSMGHDEEKGMAPMSQLKSTAPIEREQPAPPHRFSQHPSIKSSVPNPTTIMSRDSFPSKQEKQVSNVGSLPSQISLNEVTSERAPSRISQTHEAPSSISQKQGFVESTPKNAISGVAAAIDENPLPRRASLRKGNSDAMMVETPPGPNTKAANIKSGNSTPRRASIFSFKSKSKTEISPSTSNNQIQRRQSSIAGPETGSAHRKSTVNRPSVASLRKKSSLIDMKEGANRGSMSAFNNSNRFPSVPAMLSEIDLPPNFHELVLAEKQTFVHGSNDPDSSDGPVRLFRFRRSPNFPMFADVGKAVAIKLTLPDNEEIQRQYTPIRYENSEYLDLIIKAHRYRSKSHPSMHKGSSTIPTILMAAGMNCI